jgi:hypothetical protein
MRVVPGETPCYDCVVGAVQDMSFMSTKPKSAVDYTALTSKDGFKAEPGLGLDVHFIVLIQVKVALLTLLRGTNSKLEDIPYNFLFWGNRREWIFPEPFKCVYATIKKRDNCPTCGQFSSAISLNPEKAQEIVKEIVGNLPRGASLNELSKL